MHHKSFMFAVLVASLAISGCGGEDSNQHNLAVESEGPVEKTLTPSEFAQHGDILENEIITIQAKSGQTVVNLKSDLTIYGTLHIKDPQ